MWMWLTKLINKGWLSSLRQKNFLLITCGLFKEGVNNYSLLCGLGTMNSFQRVQSKNGGNEWLLQKNQSNASLAKWSRLIPTVISFFHSMYPDMMWEKCRTPLWSSSQYYNSVYSWDNIRKIPNLDIYKTPGQSSQSFLESWRQEKSNKVCYPKRV